MDTYLLAIWLLCSFLAGILYYRRLKLLFVLADSRKAALGEWCRLLVFAAAGPIALAVLLKRHLFNTEGARG